MISFKCEMCGECCRRIGLSGLLKEFENEKGECIHLTEDNLCEIYDARPDICRVDRMYELYFKDIMKLDEYLNENYKCCQNLQTHKVQN